MLVGQARALCKTDKASRRRCLKWQAYWPFSKDKAEADANILAKEYQAFTKSFDRQLNTLLINTDMVSSTPLNYHVFSLYCVTVWSHMKASRVCVVHTDPGQAHEGPRGGWAIRCQDRRWSKPFDMYGLIKETYILGEEKRSESVVVMKGSHFGRRILITLRRPDTCGIFEEQPESPSQHSGKILESESQLCQYHSHL